MEGFQLVQFGQEFSSVRVLQAKAFQWPLTGVQRPLKAFETPLKGLLKVFLSFKGHFKGCLREILSELTMILRQLVSQESLKRAKKDTNKVF